MDMRSRVMDALKTAMKNKDAERLSTLRLINAAIAELQSHGYAVPDYPANPKNDGRQTPTKGHPVFIAQHATGSNDRASLEEFYGIEMGRELTETEADRIVDVILRWIGEHLD